MNKKVIKAIEREVLKEMKNEAENARMEYVKAMAAKIANEICPNLNCQSFVWRRGETIIAISYDEKRDMNNVFISDNNILISVGATGCFASFEIKPVKDTSVDADLKNKAVMNAMRLLDDNYEDIVKSF